LVGLPAVFVHSVAVVVVEEVVVDVYQTYWDGCVVGRYVVVVDEILKIVAMISTDARLDREGPTA
jgi:hypothetical protein